MNKPELVIDVIIDESYSVQSGEKGANMVTFHGSLSCSAFNGTIMPGAVDTQRKNGDEFTLSARYMIKGKDSAGRDASVFIENNGTAGQDGKLVTTPKIITDCEGLKYLENASLSGTIEPVEKDHIHILIFKNN